MTLFFGILAALMLLDKIWKHVVVIHFFHRWRNMPPLHATHASIIQPILSGDPTLPACLESNLKLRSTHQLDYFWMLDEDDTPGIAICRSLVERYPDRKVQLVTVPASTEPVCPKTVKNALGASLSQAAIFCFVDDDVALKDGDLERCLPTLQQAGVGIAFGIPCYTNFSNFWSSLLSYFVNAFSLLVYIPASYLTTPFTINGQFFAITRERFEQVDGFRGIEYNLCDDFAITQKFAAYGLHAVQTPLLTYISNQLNGPRQYFNLIRRWYIFPKESVMKYIPPKDLALTYIFGMAAFVFPLIWVVYCIVAPSFWSLAYLLLYMLYSYLVFAHTNIAYQGGVTPWRNSWLVLVLQILFPVELLVALLSPNRIVWRGHVFQIERGGAFRYIRRRSASE